MTLLAVSGGLDSVVLAHKFQAEGRSFAIGHANFQLRGEASDGDEDFVRQLAARYGVPFFTKKFDTAAAVQGSGLSVQMMARQLRYAWLETVRAEQDYAAIATAHHLNDALETALLNFTRGTGLAGLLGIPAHNGYIVRPLLDQTRADLEAYAREHGLEWREDHTNAYVDYDRNWVRHRVVPHLLELNPNLPRTAERNFQRLRDVHDNYQHLLQVFQEDDGAGGKIFDKKKISALPAPVGALRELLRPYGFTDEQVRQIADKPTQTGLAWRSAEGYTLTNDRYDWLLKPDIPALPSIRLASDDLFVRLPDGSRLMALAIDPAPPYPDGRTAIAVDAERLVYPLVLRPWRSGDAFQPFGMGGKSQKLQDFFTHQKLPRPEKERVWVLENGDGALVWVVGFRSDERFKITDATQKALKMQWLH
jgi:tRNA(Ile)-lysidine synthase